MTYMHSIISSLIPMSLLDDDSKVPDFVLRKHTKPITALEFVRVPIAMQRRAITNDKETHDHSLTLKPFLLSGDQEGNVKLWDMATRRPAIERQCHQSHILTILQLGARDGIIDHRYFGLIITHGRDNCVKFWRLFDQQGKFTFTQVYDLPENALNFSNVDVMENELIAPNTMNSNAFDVYDIEFITDDVVNDHRLVRDMEAVDVFEAASASGKFTFEEFTLKRDSDESVNRVDKFGIIMKLLWVSDDTVYIGYESGHVASIRINPKSKKYEVLSVTKHHYPQPVLSLSYDPVQNIVISASIASQIVIYDVSTQAATAIKLDNIGKISSISTIKDKLVLSSWSGLTRFYTFDKSTYTLEYHHSFKKPKGMIAGDLNIMGNLQDTTGPKKNTVTKPNCMTMVERSTVPLSLKSKLSRRDVTVIESSFLSVGYDDGTISIYTDL